MIFYDFWEKIYSQGVSVLLFITTVYILSGCADVIKPVVDDPNAIIPLEKNDYFPLKVGNLWQYQYTEYYSGGSKHISTAYNKITNDAILTYKGRKYQCVQFNNSQWGYYWSNGKEVSFFNDFGAMKYAAKQVLLRQPIQMNDSLQMEFAAIYMNSLVKDMKFAKCVTTNGSITTPAGTFQNCIVLRYEDPILSDAISSGINYVYYARGVGQVAMLVKGESKINGVKTERLFDEYLLTSYTITP